ncbi:MAG TPA: hypothetical protein VMC07_00340 [Candidatus Omnitrophota bacterium]|nr:hypothetical protein [Candidatus Omnitrophota bacterium]
MPTTLDLSSRTYQGVIDYLKSISDDGRANEMGRVYQIKRTEGRGIVIVCPETQKVLLEDSVDYFTKQHILGVANKQARGVSL